jgi:hypothetical protein
MKRRSDDIAKVLGMASEWKPLEALGRTRARAGSSQDRVRGLVAGLKQDAGAGS